jgi:hypothetical protein
MGAALGLGLPVVGKLLGHAQAQTIQRYANLASDPWRWRQRWRLSPKSKLTLNQKPRKSLSFEASWTVDFI